MIVGAATPPGRLAAAIAFAAGTVADAAVDVLNLADTPVEICDGRTLDQYGESTRAAIGKIADAAAVLIAAPVYRASYPGVLKNLLDTTPVEALQAKPVGIVAMGGSPHHFPRRRLAAARGADLVRRAGGSGQRVYITGGDFKDGQLASESARSDLAALVQTLLILSRLERGSLGPKPLAAKFT